MHMYKHIIAYVNTDIYGVCVNITCLCTYIHSHKWMYTCMRTCTLVCLSLAMPRVTDMDIMHMQIHKYMDMVMGIFNYMHMHLYMYVYVLRIKHFSAELSA